MVGLCLPLGSGHAAELKLAGDLSRLPALVSRTSLSRSWMRLLVFLQHLDELLNSVRASIEVSPVECLHGTLHAIRRLWRSCSALDYYPSQRLVTHNIALKLRQNP